MRIAWAKPAENKSFSPIRIARDQLLTDHASEAAVKSNPGGTFFYGVWNQEDLDKKGDVIGSDAWFRRTMFVDDGTSLIPDGGSGGEDGDDGDNDTPGPPATPPGKTR